SSVLHFFENFNSNTSGDVNTAEGENLEREVAGFGAVDIGPKIESFYANRARFRQSSLSNLGRRIGVGIVKRIVLHRARQEFVQSAETPAGEDEFPTDLRVAALHEPEKFDLLFGVRSKIGMATFGRHHAIAVAVPHEQRFAEARSGRKQRATPTGFRGALIEHAKLLRVEILDAMAPSTEVVEQNNLFYFQFLGEDSSVNHPREICCPDAIVNNRTRDAEARGQNFFSCKMRGSLTRKLLRDQIELRKILASKALAENAREFAFS